MWEIGDWHAKNARPFGKGEEKVQQMLNMIKCSKFMLKIWKQPKNITYISNYWILLELPAGLICPDYSPLHECIQLRYKGRMKRNTVPSHGNWSQHMTQATWFVTFRLLVFHDDHHVRTTPWHDETCWPSIQQLKANRGVSLRFGITSCGDRRSAQNNVKVSRSGRISLGSLG